MVEPSRQSDISLTCGLLEPTEPSKSTMKRSKKNRGAKTNGRSKPNKWADKCMFAELLEMRDDDAWPASRVAEDGLPEDLESGWVVVAPVPVGKRCLAVTYQSSGIIGVGTCPRSVDLT
jgi:snurportin-1